MNSDPDDQYVPCQWICHTCGFEISKNFLNPSTGEAGGDNRDHYEQCPNDGERMERLTWKQHAKGLEKGIMLQVQRAVKAEAWISYVRSRCYITDTDYLFQEADRHAQEEAEKVSLT